MNSTSVIVSSSREQHSSRQKDSSTGTPATRTGVVADGETNTSNRKGRQKVRVEKVNEGENIRIIVVRLYLKWKTAEGK